MNNPVAFRNNAHNRHLHIRKTGEERPVVVNGVFETLRGRRGVKIRYHVQRHDLASDGFPPLFGAHPWPKKHITSATCVGGA